MSVQHASDLYITIALFIIFNRILDFTTLLQILRIFIVARIQIHSVVAFTNLNRALPSTQRLIHFHHQIVTITLFEQFFCIVVHFQIDSNHRQFQVFFILFSVFFCFCFCFMILILVFVNKKRRRNSGRRTTRRRQICNTDLRHIQTSSFDAHASHILPHGRGFDALHRAIRFIQIAHRQIITKIHQIVLGRFVNIVNANKIANALSNHFWIRVRIAIVFALFSIVTVIVVRIGHRHKYKVRNMQSDKSPFGRKHFLRHNHTIGCNKKRNDTIINFGCRSNLRVCHL
mmetsp:Transcript_20664/g.33103  ORF Transcript_20664/g.33103 Transcript_20664/m.33103 type:complete len:287 (+) Transcript_20664:593-1453(+)